ncbi:DEAD/DEAH box helicase family protein [uncultured Bacteroides sp.]|nr:DEAD/DEAH box helicase family protein [uncultured Bacteroides sp.]
MDYADVFDFDKFHEAFRQELSSAKGDECFTLESFIESRPELWHDYDLTKSSKIASILTLEIYDSYELAPDPDDFVHLPKAKKKEIQKNTIPSIRGLVKDFLTANPEEPQKLLDILAYVNANRPQPTTRRNLQSSLYQDKEVFIHFDNETWGLCSIPYDSEMQRDRRHYLGDRKKHEGVFSHDDFGPSMVCEDIEDFLVTKTNLLEQNFELRYSTKREHKPTEFFTKALSNSNTLDLGLGYFSSACFNVLACGFAHFVKNGGKMRMYINPNITEQDYKLLKESDYSGFEQYMLNSYDNLLKIFSYRDKLFFQCLSYLIINSRIEVKIVLLKDTGIAHEKFGIFIDTEGNKVAFNGSMNLTAAGLTKNIEAIDCVCSWRNQDAADRIQCYQDDFDCIWEKRNNDVLVYPADEFCRQVVVKYPTENIDELIQLENEIMEEIAKENATPLFDEPHFPIKFKDGPRQYQTDAYEAWMKRGKQGVFAMATGTGKTITSLNCALEEYKDTGFYRLLILVPSLALVEQWGNEVTNFNYRNVIKVSSENHRWKQDVMQIVTKMRHGRNVNYVIISTYQSFVMQDFQVLLPKFSDGALLIADEAHNIGSTSVRQAFHRLTIKKRIALSATPNRIYDEEGTREIESFFNDAHPYTYSFSMRRAIREDCLMPYHYFPYLAKLENSEMVEYARITQQLVQLYNSSKKGFSDPERARKLLLVRKNILHKARNKMEVFLRIIEEIGEDKLKYCFVYSAAGKRTNSDESDDEAIDEYILKEMQAILKRTFPNTTCNSYTGVDSKVMRKQKLEAFANGQLNVLFAKNCLDEGVDVPRAEYGIFTSSTGNPRQFIQRRGRLLRKHDDKRFAWIYDIIVVPDFSSPCYDRRFWTMEKHLVENEMRRVANFGSLASNYYTGALDTLGEVISFYEIDLNGMVLNESN